MLVVPEVEVEPEVAERSRSSRRRRLRDRLGKTRAAFVRLARRRCGPRHGRRRDAGTSSRRPCCSPTSACPPPPAVLDSVASGRGASGSTDADGARRALHEELVALLDASGDRTLVTTPGEPNVWMFVGVNGVGKTTTIAKVAQRETDDGHELVLAAPTRSAPPPPSSSSHWADRGRRRARAGPGGRRPGLGGVRRDERGRRAAAPTSCSSTPPAGCTPRSTS